MRILSLLLIFFSLNSLAQSPGACTHLDLQNGGAVPCTSLTVTTSPTFNANIPPLEVTVSGDVTISAPIMMNGGNGAYTTGGPGGSGGPGAGSLGEGDGGGYGGLGPDPSPEPPHSGEPGIASPTCGSGGGGGNLTTFGTAGSACSTAAGGAAGSSTYTFGALRGGFGGAAGGDNGTTLSAGTGGGGGGAIHIIATGDILINATISVRGGNGGTASSGAPGGGGGGGSGGIIWIETTGEITNNALLDVTGGSGGTSNFTGHGGRGADGVLLLQDADGVIAGTGTGALGAGSKLTSDISCGTIMAAKDNKKNNFHQVFYGFGLAAVVSFILQALRRLKFLPYS